MIGHPMGNGAKRLRNDHRALTLLMLAKPLQPLAAVIQRTHDESISHPPERSRDLRLMSGPNGDQ